VQVVNISRPLATIPAVLLLLIVLAACGDDNEADIDDAHPSIRGEVLERREGAGNISGTILVKGEMEPDTDYDYASVKVTAPVIYKIVEGRYWDATWEDVTKGQTVEVWFIGPVAESYPVQATAGQLVLLNSPSQTPSAVNPSVRGGVSGIDTGQPPLTGGARATLGYLHIEGADEPDTEYDRAQVTVTDYTRIYRYRGSEKVPTSIDAIDPGDRIEVWLLGGVADSDPPQGLAGHIIILD